MSLAEGVALYSGQVMHRRLRPHGHVLRSRVTMLLVDLPEVRRPPQRHGLLGLDCAAPISFMQSDHGDGTPLGLRDWVQHHLQQAGFAPLGRLAVLSMPRILGHGFNPISLLFCYTQTGRLQAVMHEVNNTFGQRHSYLLPAGDGDVITQSADKAFHVSPFMPMNLQYRFRVRRPSARLQIGITVSDRQGTLLTAAYGAEQRTLSNASLAAVLARTPLQGAATLFRIHWEAAKLWFKGLTYHRSPPPPAAPVTYGH